MYQHNPNNTLSQISLNKYRLLYQKSRFLSTKLFPKNKLIEIITHSSTFLPTAQEATKESE
ncbi:predicted protein [Sclerotinia sclerotiorum 1980 UF-70]|uniref:Uncharacterized protein n=1 Tax=Sclerotinia sclerotiorum (strain ATCC 18683 / 1980 / Ss-1) TaxID=665079 RepID=A7E9G7_SCLS1|nr:predicted protein [Sclerotinia sclerotiorum 1980 UF-70]EDN97019.1 predicted protein [Sclerotinia sclerotiorum 1980 UF-70]